MIAIKNLGCLPADLPVHTQEAGVDDRHKRLLDPTEPIFTILQLMPRTESPLLRCGESELVDGVSNLAGQGKERCGMVRQGAVVAGHWLKTHCKGVSPFPNFNRKVMLCYSGGTSSM